MTEEDSECGNFATTDKFRSLARNSVECRKLWPYWSVR